MQKTSGPPLIPDLVDRDKGAHKRHMLPVDLGGGEAA